MDNENKSIDNQGMTMDALVSSEVFPEVKQNAIDAVLADNKKAQEAQEKIDAAKNPHKVRLKKDGTPAAKRGRKPTTANATPNSSGFKDPKAAQPATTGVVQIPSQLAAQMISDTLETAQVRLISEEFKLNELEKKSNVDVWTMYLESTGGLSLTPLQAVLMSHGQIILQRAIGGKETRTKFALFKAYARNKFVQWRNKKNAQPDNRENIERENDLRKEESGEPKKTS